MALGVCQVSVLGAVTLGVQSPKEEMAKPLGCPWVEGLPVGFVCVALGEPPSSWSWYQPGHGPGWPRRDGSSGGSAGMAPAAKI